MLSDENGMAAVSGQGWQEAQRIEADKHTAPVCDEHGVQFAICGCDAGAEPEGEAA